MNARLDCETCKGAGVEKIKISDHLSMGHWEILERTCRCCKQNSEVANLPQTPGYGATYFDECDEIMAAVEEDMKTHNHF